MATNPSLLVENAGRITPPDTNYTYGSAKDDTTGTTGDGTPTKKAIMNDTYGLQQALLRAGGIVPSGSADTQLTSQYLEGIVQQAQGRGYLVDDTGGVNVYVIGLRANQQGPGALFEGQRFVMPPNNTNTGASTMDLSALKGEDPGSTVVDIKLPGGLADLAADSIIEDVESPFIYRTAPSPHVELAVSGQVLTLEVFDTSGTWVQKADFIYYEIVAGGGAGGFGGGSSAFGGGGGGGGAVR